MTTTHIVVGLGLVALGFYQYKRVKVGDKVIVQDALPNSGQTEWTVQNFSPDGQSIVALPSAAISALPAFANLPPLTIPRKQIVKNETPRLV